MPMVEVAPFDIKKGFSKGSIRDVFFGMRVIGAGGFFLTIHNTEFMPNFQNPALYLLAIGLLGVVGAIGHFGYNEVRHFMNMSRR